MPELAEHARRKPRAEGIPVILADGQFWLLAAPTFGPEPKGLTRPRVDQVLDRIFECTVLGENLSSEDVLNAARALLKANYELSDDETACLVSVAPGVESRALAGRILDALFGADDADKTYTAWVRASLIANGLGRERVSARDLVNVLAILVATNRTIPLPKFADACRLLDERARLETLI